MLTIKRERDDQAGVIRTQIRAAIFAIEITVTTQTPFRHRNARLLIPCRSLLSGVDGLARRGMPEQSSALNLCKQAGSRQRAQFVRSGQRVELAFN